MRLVAEGRRAAAADAATPRDPGAAPAEPAAPPRALVAGPADVWEVKPALRAILRSVEHTLGAGSGAGPSPDRDELRRVAVELRQLLGEASPLEEGGRGGGDPSVGPRPARPRPGAVVATDQPRILIVGGQARTCEEMATGLRAAGMRADLVPTVAAAVAWILEEGLPDLLIVDVAGEADGLIQLCRRLRVRLDRSELPILLIADAGDRRCVDAGVEVGANDYLVRPLSGSELLARVRTHLHVRALTRAYSRYVPREFLRYLHRESIVDVELGDYVEREMTVMFMDIRSFTSLSESMSPQQNFNFLNSYLQRVAPVVQAYGGFIDKYVGDGIMALFPDEPAAALNAAIEIRGTIRLYNRHRARCNYRPIEVGIGIHTGQLILGTIGYADRMETTVISDSVNLASRLETLNKHYGTTTIVSESTLAASGGPFAARYLGRVQVTGREGCVPVFDLYQGDPPALFEAKEAFTDLFEQAVRLYEAGEIAEAAARFQVVAQGCPKDPAARLFKQRCDELAMAFGPRLPTARQEDVDHLREGVSRLKAVGGG